MQNQLQSRAQGILKEVQIPESGKLRADSGEEGGMVATGLRIKNYPIESPHLSSPDTSLERKLQGKSGLSVQSGMQHILTYRYRDTGFHTCFSDCRIKILLTSLKYGYSSWLKGFLFTF